jgi:hypothetical protein
MLLVGERLAKDLESKTRGVFYSSLRVSPFWRTIWKLLSVASGDGFLSESLSFRIP